MDQHSNPEPAKNLRRDAAGLACAYNSGSLAVEVEVYQSAERKVQLGYSIEFAMDLAVQREQQRYGMLSNGVLLNPAQRRATSSLHSYRFENLAGHDAWAYA